MGSGGGYTVGVELWRELARARPDWTITLAAVTGNRLHEEAKREEVPTNCQLLWAPEAAKGLMARARYERRGLIEFVRTKRVDAVLQLNGMAIRGMPVPTLAHCQDPWPFRPEAWTRGLRDRVSAWVKRRALAASFSRAAYVGWTSAYLRDLMIARLQITPKRGEVFYNGLSADLLARAKAPEAMDYPLRPLRMVTISNVGPYKRQDLVIRAMPELHRRPGLRDLQYHIAGHVEETYRHELESLAKSLGVSAQVHIEGRVSRHRIDELFASARCFVLMSVCESFGVPAIEAMSFGTPVVTTDCCAMPEVCSDAADFVPMDNLTALIDRLGRVLTDSAHAEELRRRGKTRVHGFAWSATAARIAQALEHVSPA
ncbi:MAG TPA: glycosyltransferase [Phycisphaerae bacterium]|nr:glycosyltransferase [Phycisphaerae bacterium]